MEEYCRVHADVNLDCICNNIKRTREKIAKNTKIMAIVKADAYGHGAVAVSKALDPLVDAYGVAVIQESVELRKAGITKPILILGYVPKPYVKTLVEYDVMTAVFQYEIGRASCRERV